MKKQAVAVAMMSLFLMTIFSGCTGQQKTNNDGQTSLNDTFSVNGTGGEFSLLQDAVEVNVFSGCVSEQVDITVESITDPGSDPSLHMLSCYEFGPDGQRFEKDIELIFHYDVDDLPTNLSESAIKVYVLNGSNWEPVPGSFVNLVLHYAVAKVSHFSKMGCGGPAAASSGDDDGSDGGSDDDGNTSAQYWFKADLYFFDHKTLRLTDDDDDDMYSVGVSAYWDPVPYVQYYQIKFEYGENPPATQYAWGCDWGKQAEDWCSQKTIYDKTQGYIYHLGGDPNLEGFLGLYDGTDVATAGKYNQETGEMEHYEYGRVRPAGTHGFGFFGVYDTVEDSEGLSDLDKTVLVGQMQLFVKDYVDGWEIWVRGVTERGD